MSHAFWKGVLAWVGFSTLLLASMCAVIMLLHIGFYDMTLLHKSLLLKIFIFLAVISYLTYIFSKGELKEMCRGFLTAGIIHLLLCTLFGLILYPIVGFAVSIFYLVATYKIATIQAKREAIKWL